MAKTKRPTDPIVLVCPSGVELPWGLNPIPRKEELVQLRDLEDAKRASSRRGMAGDPCYAFRVEDVVYDVLEDFVQVRIILR
ncbi:MAG: hypothetical protein KGL39_46510 [Patescibacteria group bacterium]|nr:hypothetical protein [Patescibacteria group bacterium]